MPSRWQHSRVTWGHGCVGLAVSAESLSLCKKRFNSSFFLPLLFCYFWRVLQTGAGLSEIILAGSELEAGLGRSLIWLVLIPPHCKRRKTQQTPRVNNQDLLIVLAPVQGSQGFLSSHLSGRRALRPG